MPAKLGIPLRTKLIISSTGRNSLIVLGVSEPTVALVRSLPIRISAAVSMCPPSTLLPEAQTVPPIVPGGGQLLAMI